MTAKKKAVTLAQARKAAKAVKAVKEKRMGRPSSFKPEFQAIARKLCLMGATDKDLAEAFGVTEQTVNNWKVAHPDFFESLKDAKAEADAEIEKSLFQRALGYRHDAVKIMSVGNEVREVPYEEHYPPDTTACIFWLKNRKPLEWRDKQEIEHSGGVELSAALSKARGRLLNA